MENIVNVTVDLSKLTEKQLEQLMYIVGDYEPGFYEALNQEIIERLKDGRIKYTPKQIPSDWDITVSCAKEETGCPNDGSCHNFSLWQPFINPELTKAKEIIKDYMTIVKGAHTAVCGVPEENRTIYVLKLNEKAERFISEVEKWQN